MAIMRSRKMIKIQSLIDAANTDYNDWYDVLSKYDNPDQAINDMVSIISGNNQDTIQAATNAANLIYALVYELRLQDYE